MAITKNPLVRYRILNAFFKDPYKNYTIDLLLKELNKKLVALNREADEINIEKDCIKMRQLRNDIVFMKSDKGYCIQLDDLFEGKKRIYRYEDINFSITNSPLNDVEIDEFQSAIQVLAQFEGMPQFEGIQEIIAKLKYDLKGKVDAKPFIGFDSNQDLKGIEHFSFLYNSVQNKSPLQIVYKDFKSEVPYLFVLHPYYLKQYNNRWFLFGLNQQTNKPDWNVAIDRIVSVEFSSEKFIPNNRIDWQEYFSDMVGVSKPENASIEEVVLHFNQLTGRYMENKSIHETQKHKWINENTFEVRIKVYLNYELERLILSYGDSAKVVSPVQLQNNLKKRLKLGFEQY